MKTTRLLMLMLFLAGLGSCGKTKTDSGPVWPMRKVSSGGSYTVSLQPVDGKTIEQHKHFSLAVTLSAKNTGAKSEADKVLITADMPEHQHGMNTKPELIKTEANQYRINGMLFHMAGEWVITVNIDPGGGKWERADFSILIE